MDDAKILFIDEGVVEETFTLDDLGPLKEQILLMSSGVPYPRGSFDSEWGQLVRAKEYSCEQDLSHFSEDERERILQEYDDQLLIAEFYSTQEEKLGNKEVFRILTAMIHDIWPEIELCVLIPKDNPIESTITSLLDNDSVADIVTETNPPVVK